MVCHWFFLLLDAPWSQSHKESHGDNWKRTETNIWSHLAGNFGIFSPKNLNSLNSLWWNANSICYEVLMATGRCWLQNLGCRYWNHMPQPSLLLEGKKFLRIKDEGRLVVDVWTPRTWKKKRHSMSWTHWHVLSLFGGEGFFIENCPSTKARMQRWATLSSK